MAEDAKEETTEIRESFTKSFTGSPVSIRSFYGEPSDPTPLPSEVPFSIDVSEPLTSPAAELTPSAPSDSSSEVDPE